MAANEVGVLIVPSTDEETEATRSCQFTFPGPQGKGGPDDI